MKESEGIYRLFRFIKKTINTVQSAKSSIEGLENFQALLHALSFRAMLCHFMYFLLSKIGKRCAMPSIKKTHIVVLIVLTIVYL